jgi:tetratricopeptide (TPR) repeat protein
VNRAKLIAAFIVSNALVCCHASADTIHLKNGRTIVADSVRQRGERLEYNVGDDTYAIPRSSVISIDTAGATASSSSAGSLQIPQAEVKSVGGAALEPRLFIGPWTPEVIEQAERSNDPAALASILLYAAADEQRHGKLADARSHLERALGIYPNDPVLLKNYVSVLLQSERASVAVKFAEQACREDPESAEAHALLGLAYFKNDQSKRAVAEWKKSLAIKDDATVRTYMARAQREVTSEVDYTQQQSSHFALRYEGKQTSESFRRQLLETLERHYNDLVNDLEVLPRDTIPVVLYTSQAYFDVTQAPAWSAAVNDGKLRIPAEGLETVSPALSRVLKHELTHSFVNQASRNRCPHWLNEGIAQMEEPRSASSQKQSLAQLYKDGRAIPLRALNTGFTNYSDSQAMLAYVESLALVEYIRDTYGVSALTEILQHLGEGADIDSAMRASVHSTEEQLEREFADRVIRTSGL